VLFLLMAIWSIGATVLRAPWLVRRFFHNRRRDRGYHALSHGLIAAGSGDITTARANAGSSRKLLGDEPLVELLEAQTLLLEGNRVEARKRFTRMLENDETRLVAMRGLHLEAEREGESEAARHYAEQAAGLQPTLPWAGKALLRYQSAEGDWEGALRTLENIRASGQIDKQEAQRKRAVLLTAQAMAVEPAEPDHAARLAKEANKLAPDLVPAAIIGARAMTRIDDIRHAAKMLESVWKKQPHPEIANAYIHLRSGDSVADRLKRAHRLNGLSAGHVEGSFAIAEAAVDAKDWAAARKAMKPLLEAGPTERACLIMADIEEGQYGDKGRMRDWLARAVRARRDPAWTADGQVSEHWLPVSPVTGELDAFEWKVPVEDLDRTDVIGRDETISGLIEPLDESRIEEIAEPLPVEDSELLKAATDKETAAAAQGAIIEPVETITPAPGTQNEKPEHRGEEDKDTEQTKESAQQRLPDDPGIEPEEEHKNKKGFGLF
jgi:HemY protein